MFKEGLLSLLPTGVLGLFLFYLLSKGTDFGTGLLKTWKNKNSYKSRIMRDGIIRWIAEFIALVFVMGLDILLGLNFLISYATLGLFIFINDNGTKAQCIPIITSKGINALIIAIASHPALS